MSRKGVYQVASVILSRVVQRSHIDLFSLIRRQIESKLIANGRQIWGVGLILSFFLRKSPRGYLLLRILLVFSRYTLKNIET